MNRIKKVKSKIKTKSNNYLQFGKSLTYLMKILNSFYVFSVGFDDIYYGIKRPKRFRRCIYVTFYFLIVTIIKLNVALDELWLKIHGPFLPNNFRTLYLSGALLFMMVALMKIDILLAEKNYNLNPFKVLYYLMCDMKWKHKLIDSNYKKLAILSKLVETGLMDYAGPVIALSSTLILIRIAIASKKLICYFDPLIMATGNIIVSSTITSYFCVIYIVLMYYKMRFEQNYNQIKSMLENGKMKIITLRKEKKLLRLIYEHSFLSFKVYQVNLVLRKTVAILYLFMSLIKIVSLYLMITSKDTYFMIQAANIFLSFFIFGFALSYLFSQQIKSAHKCHKLIHSIICKYTIRFSLKYKVNKFKI